jgi:desulfoferrodoxin (superoxide reductase-like protein)
MFFGIIVYMYFVDNRQHHRPHLHARYQGHEVVVSVPEGEVLAGSLPPNKTRLLLAWIELHRDELVANWQLAVAGEPPFHIEPLK